MALNVGLDVPFDNMQGCNGITEKGRELLLRKLMFQIMIFTVKLFTDVTLVAP
jgi:hypothetical protein